MMDTVKLSDSEVERVRIINAGLNAGSQSPTPAFVVFNLAVEVEKLRSFLRAADDAIQQGVSPADIDQSPPRRGLGAPPNTERDAQEPDDGCITSPSGDCVSELACMHTPPPDSRQVAYDAAAQRARGLGVDIGWLTLEAVVDAAIDAMRARGQ